jgi:hypothetical protein
MPASYRFLHEEENVKMKVPQKSEYMKFVSAHSFKAASGKTVFVESHWRSKSSIDGQLVQRNFFGISEEQLGKNVVGKMRIATKKTSRSKETVWLIDIWVDSEKTAEYKLVFGKDEHDKLQLDFHTVNQLPKILNPQPTT